MQIAGIIFQTRSSTPSEQELKFGDTCFVPVLGKISTAMWWHRLEILTTQWCEPDGVLVLCFFKDQ